MAVTITVEDVRKLINTNLDDSVIQCMIDVVDEADDCLDANGVPDSIQKQLKLYGVAHQIVMAQGGQVESLTAQEGASKKWKAVQGSGLDATNFGQMVRQLDRHGCLIPILDNTDNGFMFIGSIGPGGQSGAGGSCNC